MLIEASYQASLLQCSGRLSCSMVVTHFGRRGASIKCDRSTPMFSRRGFPDEPSVNRTRTFFRFQFSTGLQVHCVRGKSSVGRGSSSMKGAPKRFFSRYAGWSCQPLYNEEVACFAGSNPNFVCRTVFLSMRYYPKKKPQVD